MCAIIGALGKNLPSQEQFIKARDTMTHRGPDDAGIYYAPQEGIALGHRRLSIIDLSKDGCQPFTSNDGRFVITYNGEIYNYLEIKKELKGKYDFKTKTDTEVLLAAYIVWGEKSLQKFNGMFAFAIWDREKRELFCARDRLGIKPLCYFFKNNTFYFASEIKALHALGIPGTPNENIIFDYLYNGFYDHTEETFFKDIKQLRAGHYLIFGGDKLKFNQYWTLKNVSIKDDSLKEDEVRETFKELFRDSIMLRFRSDVSVGITLSSGLDSGSLLYFSKEILGQDIPTFSVCYQSEEYNECGLLENRLTKRQKEKWHTVIPNPENVMSESSTMNVIQDQPFGGLPTVAMAHLYQLAHENNAKVLLSGQAVDELLAGYKYYLPEYEKDRAGAPLKQVTSQSLLSQDMSPLIDVEILNKDFVKKYQKEIKHEQPFKSHLLNAQYRDIVHTKLPRALRFNDHISMAASRELRLPYLDYRLVEFCFSLPARYKISNTSQKVLLRDVMEEYIPRVVKNTQKKAFSAAQSEWLRKYHKKAVYDILNSSPFKKRLYWNHDALLQKVDLFFKGEGDNSFFVWQCINLELWFREFID